MLMIRHIVLMKCKPDASQPEIDRVFVALAALQGKIPGLSNFQGGANNSPENSSRGYTHAFSLDFADAPARDAYLPHPEHQKVVAQIRKILDGSAESVLVVDFMF